MHYRTFKPVETHDLIPHDDLFSGIKDPSPTRDLLISSPICTFREKTLLRIFPATPPEQSPDLLSLSL